MSGHVAVIGREGESVTDVAPHLARGTHVSVTGRTALTSGLRY